MKELTAGSFLLNKEKNEAAEAASRVPSATGTLDLQRTLPQTNSFPPIRSIFHVHSEACKFCRDKWITLNINNQILRWCSQSVYILIKLANWLWPHSVPITQTFIQLFSRDGEKSRCACAVL